MTNPVFGVIEKPEALNLEPFGFTLVGYAKPVDEDGHIDQEATAEPIEYEFTASGVRPFYNQIEMTRAAAAENGVLAGQAIADFIELSLIDDDERTRWRETLATPNVYFDADVLYAISNWLGEQYTGRPIQPRSARRSSQSRGSKSSRGAVGVKAGATSAASRRR